MDTERAIIERNADIFKALSNPVRLCIVKGLLSTRGCTVTHMQSCIDSSQSTLSQHVGKLKSLGIIKGERIGKEIIYKVSNEEVIKIINILFE
ncbi:MAG: winged helix-turn-helix transcriptional regulator [Clostridia bacterium]|nr:winged helix-turn-helix transcriptional regulator [Clostridia bacterium]